MLVSEIVGGPTFSAGVQTRRRFGGGVESEAVSPSRSHSLAFAQF